MSHTAIRSTFIMTFIFIILSCSIFIAPPEAQAAEILVVHYPPLMIKDGGERPGFSIELIKEVERRIGQNSTIRFYPFSRMAKTLMNNKMAIFPSLYRNPQKEDKLIWIAKVFSVENAFHTIGKPVNSIEEAKALGRIGVVEKTAQHQFLIAQGFTNLDVVTRPEINAKKLAAGRIDAWYLTTFLAHMIWDRQSISTPLVSGTPVLRPEAYVVANKEFPQDLADKYKAGVQQIQKDGTLKKIAAKYGLDISPEMVIIHKETRTPR